MYGNTYTSQPISLDALPLADVSRVDIQFHGVEHSGPSFEARVFINKPDAVESTELDPDNGYAGSFYVFGHGGCYGDTGHCEIHAEPGPYDPRPSHVLTPIRKFVTATEALRRAADESRDVTITVVPVITGLTEQCDVEDVFRFRELSIVTYKSEEEAARQEQSFATA
jgi:hypothetical protein